MKKILENKKDITDFMQEIQSIYLTDDNKLIHKIDIFIFIGESTKEKIDDLILEQGFYRVNNNDNN